MAELSNGGSGTGEMISSASVVPRASIQLELERGERPHGGQDLGEMLVDRFHRADLALWPRSSAGSAEELLAARA